jgi:Na+-driven multidrug efflux pump
MKAKGICVTGIWLFLLSSLFGRNGLLIIRLRSGRRKQFTPTGKEKARL